MSVHGKVHTLDECLGLIRIVPRQPPSSVIGTVVILVALVGAVVAWSALTWADVVVRGPARVRAHAAPRLSFASSSGDHVYAATAGRIAAIEVVEGQTVAAGDVLARLDATVLANDLARLEAELATAISARDAAKRMESLAAARHEASQATRAEELALAQSDEVRARRRSSADARLAAAALRAARREAERLRLLEIDGAASPAQVEQATGRIGEARAKLDAARVGSAVGQAEVVRRQQLLAEREWAVQREQLAQAVSATAGEAVVLERRVANARLALEAATIRADVAGVIGGISVGVTDPVQPGQLLFTVAPGGKIRIDAAIPAADIAEVRVGMRVRVRLDAFDWQRHGVVAGTISQISSDAEALGAANGPQQPVYVIRIELDSDEIGRETRHRLKLGMTGTVEIVTRRERLLRLVVGRLRHAVSL